MYAQDLNPLKKLESSSSVIKGNLLAGVNLMLKITAWAFAPLFIYWFVIFLQKYNQAKSFWRR